MEFFFVVVKGIVNLFILREKFIFEFRGEEVYRRILRERILCIEYVLVFGIR